MSSSTRGEHLATTWPSARERLAPRPTARPRPSRASQITPLPVGHLRDYDVVREVADRVTEVAARARARIEVVAGRDPVSEDLLIAVPRTLGKQLLILRVQHAHS
jgi:hypothetical protein